MMARVAVLGVMPIPTPAAIVSVACAALAGSACGVTEMVTLFGVGAALGAV